MGKTFELLNCDKHKAMLLRSGRDPAAVRPDITHQVLKGSAETAPGGWGAFWGLVGVSLALLAVLTSNNSSKFVSRIIFLQ